MALISLFLYIVVVAVIGAAAVWLLGQLAPGHPAILDTLVWVVVVILIVLVLAQAFGVAGINPQIPRLR